ncbi:MAG: NADP-dependent oxidoreductase [Streptosporangiaceae bacterium]|jgi:NADPH:quinone reductase-like Zn-dependent oxidoreductase
MKAVRFDKYGGRDVLYIANVEVPSPAAGEVVVQVKAAALNPGEASIREGYLDAAFPTTFPSGEGSDLAGVVTAVGDGVTEFSVGDEVLGWSWTRSSHAEYTAVPVSQLIPKPASVPWPVAGALYVVAATAYAAVRAVAAGPGDTVVVSAAAGGVGTVVVQLLKVKGASVIGIASQAHHEWLTTHGVTPVAYGDGLADRLRAAAPDGIDAFIDLFGPEYVRLAVELGVPRDRIETIIAFDAAREYGTKAEGSGTASTTGVLAEMTGLVADGLIEIPIAASYPLDHVQQAYAEVEQRHTLGKVVLIP